MQVLILSFFSTFLAWAQLPTVSQLLEESRSVNWEDGISRRVVINAPLEKVWTYASDSTKAVEWSIYFDHISPLPGVPDGQPGALRRCFRNKDESGESWDEVTIEIEPLKSRQIVTYNFVNYPLSFIHSDRYINVRQLYRALDDGKTELTFQTQLPKETGLLFKLLFKFASSETADIFEKNLSNIKAAIEEKPRPYPWR